MRLEGKNKKMKDYFSMDPEFFSSINPKHVVIGFIVIMMLGSPIIILVRMYELSMLAPYPDAREHKEKIEGTVKRKREYKSAILVDFADGRKFHFEKGNNYKYDRYDLYSFLNSGDSIVKPALSDTLYIYRDNQEYFFVLGKRIGGRK